MRPEDAGIHLDGVPRHVKGLRRREVAQLAGISETWYTWIEQRREITISAEVLEQIATALQLSPRESEYLKTLGLASEPLPFHPNPAIPDQMRELVLSHRNAPAYVATPRFDLLVWNEFVTDVFDYHFTDDPLSRNVLWRMFFDETRRHVYVDWDRTAQMGVANFRYAFARYRGNEHFEQLLDRLLEHPDFTRMWDRWHVLPPNETSPFLVRSRNRGLCELAPVQATIDAAPGCFLTIFSCKQMS